MNSNTSTTTENVTKAIAPQTLTLAELSPYFHLPINDAATQLGICSTALKKICRSIGVKRWPHRKIKSLDNMIESLQQLIDTNEGDIPKLNMDMEDLLAKRKYLMENPNTNYKNVISKYAINSFHSKVQRAQSKNTSPTLAATEVGIGIKPIGLPKPTKTIMKKSYNYPNRENKMLLPHISSITSTRKEVGENDETLEALKAKFYSYVAPLNPKPRSPQPNITCSRPFLNPFPHMNPYMVNRPLRMSG